MTHAHPVTTRETLPPTVDESVITVAPDAAFVRGAGAEPALSTFHRWLILILACTSLMVMATDQTIVATALHAIQRDLGSSLTWSAWTITVYALGQTIAMPIAGRVSDQFGRKTVFLTALAIFTLATMCCAIAASLWQLIAFRGIQALGGGSLLPCATGLVADNFGPNRDRAIAMFGSIFPLGGIIGPLAGSVIVTYLSWRAIFLVTVPITTIVFLLAVRFTPRGGAAPGRRRIDTRGLVLFTSLMLGAMYVISAAASARFPGSWVVLGLVATLVVVVGIAFARHAVRHPSPFIPLRLLHGRGFAIINLITLMFGAVALGFNSLVPLYAQDRYHISVLDSGTLLVARAIGMVCLASLAALAIRRTGYRAPLGTGIVLIATSLVGMALAPPLGLSPYVWLSITAGITGVGTGLSSPASNNAVLHLAGENIAAAAGMRGMFRQVGAILSVSIATAVVASAADPGFAQAAVFLAFAALMLVILPFVVRVPEHRGSW